MRKCNDEIYQLAKDQALVKKLKNKRFRPDPQIIFQIRLQTLMKLVDQAKYIYIYILIFTFFYFPKYLLFR
jgi:hypothetical protein